MRLGLPETVDLGRREAEDALSTGAPFGDFRREPQAPAAFIDRVGILHAHRDTRRVVVAQVLADTGQRVAHRNAE